MTAPEFMRLPEQVKDQVFLIWAQLEYPSAEAMMLDCKHSETCDECRQRLAHRFNSFLQHNVTAEMIDLENAEKNLWN